MALLDPKDPKNLGVSNRPATNPLMDFNPKTPIVDELDMEVPVVDPNDDLELDVPYVPPVDDLDVEAGIGDTDDPYQFIGSDFNPDEVVLEDEVMDEGFEPQTFEDYKAERLERGEDFDWLGAKENSLIKHGVEWGRQALYDWYVPEESIRGRQIQDMKLRKKLEALGPVESYDRGKQYEAESLWDQRNDIKFKNYLDEQVMNADTPSMGAIKEAIINDPKQFLKGFAQELANKPELFLIPQLAAARGAVAAGIAAEAATLGARGTQVAIITGELIGAGVGGMTVGTLDRVLKQSTVKGDVDVAKAMEQSQVDAILGVVVQGGARAISKGVNTVRRQKKVDVQANEFANKATLNTVDEMAELRYREKVQRVEEDPAIESWIDDNGNVYNYEVREVLDKGKLEGQLKGLQNLNKLAGQSKADRDIINYEIDRVSKELEDKTLSAGKLEQLVNKRSELSAEAEGIPTRGNAAKEWFTGSEKTRVVEDSFMKVTDGDGVEHTLKRLQSAKRDNINIEGVQGVDLTGNFSVQKQNNKLMEVIKDYTVSATASLEKVAKMSPTAKLMLDSINPTSRNGRSPINTIQENTTYHQGNYIMKSVDLKAKMEELGVPEEAVRDHMRGVNISEDPRVLEVSNGVRALLDDVKDYAKQKGMKMDEAKDFLPRYYDQSKVTEELANQIAAEISTIPASKASGGAPKYQLNDIRKSMNKIKTNTQESDEMGPITGDGDVRPIGHRSWKEVPDSVLAPIMKDDFMAQIDRYIMNTVKRTEVDTVFGQGGSNIDDWINKISKEVQDINPQDTKFGKDRYLTESEESNIRDIPKLLGGAYGGKSRGKGATDLVLAAETWAKLPLVTVTSIFEPVTMLNRLNESSGIKDFVNVYASKAKKSFNDVPKEQIVREAKAIGLIHDQAVAERLDAMVGEGLTGFPAKMTKAAMSAFRLHQWTEHTRAMAYQASRNDLLQSIKGLSLDPKSSKSLDRQRWLSEMNVDPRKSVDWYLNGADINDPFFETIKRGAGRFTNTMIASPNKINKGKLSSSNNSAARLVTQFKGFSNVFANEVVGSAFDEARTLWNQGNKVKAMRKVSGVFATVSAMAYWTTYKTGLLTGEGAIGDDTGVEVAGKMANGVTGMLIPGAAMMAPLAEGYGLGNILGPAAGDAEKIMTGKNLKGLAPTYTKAVEAITE